MADWNVYDQNCPTRLVLNRVADKWTVLLVGCLAERTMRFGELRRTVNGISQKMLTQTLRGMERDGLISRKVYPTVPPKVEYSLTGLGKTLVAMLEQVRDWSEDHIEQVLAAQAAYDANINAEEES